MRSALRVKSAVYNCLVVDLLYDKLYNKSNVCSLGANTMTTTRNEYATYAACTCKIKCCKNFCKLLQVFGALSLFYFTCALGCNNGGTSPLRRRLDTIVPSDHVDIFVEWA